MFIFENLVKDLRGILRQAALRLWSNSILTKDKQSGNKALRFKKRVSEVTLGRLDLG